MRTLFNIVTAITITFFSNTVSTIMEVRKIVTVIMEIISFVVSIVRTKSFTLNILALKLSAIYAVNVGVCGIHGVRRIGTVINVRLRGRWYRYSSVRIEGTG
jgi:hypothetical protein